MRTILVIDDERPTLMMFELYLGAYGHPVLTAASGEEGLAVFAANEPPIVLTDVKMPGMDGLAVLAAIKERRPETEVIVITGHGDTELALAALALRATDFIDKPIRREVLEAALGRATARLDLREATGGRFGDISVEREGKVGVIAIRGSLSGETEPYLIRAVKEADGASQFLFAFSPDASINGAGLDLLLQAAEDCREAGRPVAVCGLSENFARILDRFGVTAKAPRFADCRQALDYLASRETG
jgi:CheY-like chemotaxis protein/anti-anti-sigma regulatory factor